MSKLLLKVKAINTSRGCRCFLNKFFSTLSKPQLRRVFSIDEIPCLTRMRHVTLVLQEFRETYSLLFLRAWFANEVCVVWVVLSVTAELVLFSSHSFKLLHTSQPSGPSHPGPGPRSPGPSLHQIHQQRLQSSNQASTTAALPRFVHRGTAEAFEFVLHGSGLFACHDPWYATVCHGMPWFVCFWRGFNMFQSSDLQCWVISFHLSASMSAIRIYLATAKYLFTTTMTPHSTTYMPWTSTTSTTSTICCSAAETIIDLHLQKAAVHRLRCRHVAFRNAKELQKRMILHRSCGCRTSQIHTTGESRFIQI